MNHSIFAQSRTAVSGRRTKETGIRDFLDCLADAKYQSGIHEGHYDVSVEFLCNQNHNSSSGLIELLDKNYDNQSSFLVVSPFFLTRYDHELALLTFGSTFFKVISRKSFFRYLI